MVLVVNIRDSFEGAKVRTDNRWMLLVNEV